MGLNNAENKNVFNTQIYGVPGNSSLIE